MKTCTRCGEAKPDDSFRSYYGRSSGTYTYCKDCEAIEGRRKYINRQIAKGVDTQRQRRDLEKINELYAKRAAQGLSVPGMTKAASRSKSIDALIDAELEKRNDSE